MHSAETKDVVVIGGGLAGLCAARELAREGLTVAVLEARDRVGGRLLSFVTDDGVTVDLGAQWIATFHHRVRALISEFGLTTTETYHTGKTLYELNGRRRLVAGELPPVSPLGLLDVLNFKRKVESLLEGLPVDAPWRHPRAAELDAQTVSTFVDRCFKTTSGKVFYTTVGEEALSQPLGEISLLDMAWCIQTIGSFEKAFQAEAEWLPGGAQALAHHLAESLGDRVHVSAPVHRIDYSEDGASVHTHDRVFRCRKVILALPPALAGRIAYDPPLPASREQLTHRAGQSASIKVVMIYPRPFWREVGLSGAAYADQGYVRATMDSSTPGLPYGVLTGLIGGAYARSFRSLSEDAQREAVLKDMERMFGPEASRPQAMFTKDWCEDPWARGGYAIHFAPGVITQFGPALFAPVGPMHWAGTETATEHRLYMEGALQSGERAAREVLAALATAPSAAVV